MTEKVYPDGRAAERQDLWFDRTIADFGKRRAVPR
jgi:hypothetical protein